MWLLVAVGIGVVVGAIVGRLTERGTGVGAWAGAGAGVPVYVIGLYGYRGVDDGYGWPLAVLGVGVVIGAVVGWIAYQRDPYDRAPKYWAGGVAGVGAVVAGSWATDILLTRVDRSIRASTKGAIGLGGAVVALVVIALIVWAAANDHG